MEPACVQSCRILEVGCGDGTNLISIGLGLPNARLVGVDLAEKPIEHGRNIVRISA
jgi:2-polyprenyl-3-methyl-5-hydroxy-6-metoxy-1,4-benzoquinol methylase